MVHYRSLYFLKQPSGIPDAMKGDLRDGYTYWAATKTSCIFTGQGSPF